MKAVRRKSSPRGCMTLKTLPALGQHLRYLQYYLTKDYRRLENLSLDRSFILTGRLSEKLDTS